MARSDWRRPKVSPPEEGMRRIKLTLAYDGSAFHGWQRQEKDASVQQTLEEAILSLTGENVVISGSGRTDAGVHALGQVCHFDIKEEVSIPPERYRPALNSSLPLTLRILSSVEAEGAFHARFTAMAREYGYLVKAEKDFLPQDVGRYARVAELPSLELLSGYASLIKGTHDFTTFASSKDDCPSKRRDIYESYWSAGLDAYGLPFYKYSVVGNAFLYHQVRSMVGTMLTLAKRGADKDTFKELLEAKDRSLVLTTAPASGLYLVRISYDEDEYRWFEEGEGK